MLAYYVTFVVKINLLIECCVVEKQTVFVWSGYWQAFNWWCWWIPASNGPVHSYYATDLQYQLVIYSQLEGGT